MPSLCLFYSLKRFEIYFIPNIRPFHTISCSRIKTFIALRSVCSSLSITQTIFKTPLHPITGDKLINKDMAIFNSQPSNNTCEHSNYGNLFISALSYRFSIIFRDSKSVLSFSKFLYWQLHCSCHLHQISVVKVVFPMAELKWQENIISQLQNCRKNPEVWISVPLYFANLSGNAALLTTSEN